MSASDPNSAIFMSDTPSQIKNKINRHAFSGGRESLEEHRKHGGNPDVDVAFTYLSYFLEDDAELEDLASKYRSGEMLTGEMKARCISELQKFVGSFQEARGKVSYETMREFTTPRKLVFGGNPNFPGLASDMVGLGVSNGVLEKAGDANAGKNAEDSGSAAAGKDGRGTKGERKAAKLAEKRAQQAAEKLALRGKGGEQDAAGS